MRTTATALAVGATALAIPTAAHPAARTPRPLPSALRAPLAGHLTVAGQMRAARRAPLARTRRAGPAGSPAGSRTRATRASPPGPTGGG